MNNNDQMEKQWAFKPVHNADTNFLLCCGLCGHKTFGCLHPQQQQLVGTSSDYIILTNQCNTRKQAYIMLLPQGIRKHIILNAS
jgi:hypothetical protein